VHPVLDDGEVVTRCVIGRLSLEYLLIIGSGAVIFAGARQTESIAFLELRMRGEKSAACLEVRQRRRAVLPGSLDGSQHGVCRYVVRTECENPSQQVRGIGLLLRIRNLRGTLEGQQRVGAGTERLVESGSGLVPLTHAVQSHAVETEEAAIARSNRKQAPSGLLCSLVLPRPQQLDDL